MKTYLVILALAALLAGCASPQAAPTSIIQTVIVTEIVQAPTYTPYPTYTPAPPIVVTATPLPATDTPTSPTGTPTRPAVMMTAIAEATSRALTPSAIPPTATPPPTLTSTPNPKIATAQALAEKNAAATARAAQASQVTATALAASKDALAKVAGDKFGDKLKNTSFAKVGTKNVATVDYDLGLQWDENTAVLSIVYDFIEVTQRVFEINDIDTLELRPFTTFTDIYGKESIAPAAKFTITRQAANKIDWKGVDPHKIGLILSVEAGCGVYMHPALGKAWTAFQSK